uniref:Uncharacterized protein n=1 Tax=Leptospira santarosai serovar Arenal str. MAVJ 401 TaxID=1049976 RepID=M6JUF3_9LEPT|nr:hypothetical protein LEP1GSC063_0550 [Leptospira santarosai serovar Arenal str. MAVJ 401]
MFFFFSPAPIALVAYDLSNEIISGFRTLEFLNILSFFKLGNNSLES